MNKVSVEITFEKEFVTKYAKKNDLDFETAANTLFSNCSNTIGEFNRRIAKVLYPNREFFETDENFVMPKANQIKHRTNNAHCSELHTCDICCETFDYGDSNTHYWTDEIEDICEECIDLVDGFSKEKPYQEIVHITYEIK